MTVTPHEVLGRVAATLRREVGPAVGEPFAKTQAFMASVILAKLAGQLRAAESDARLAAEERQRVTDELDRRLGAPAPAGVAAAVAGLRRDGAEADWNRLVGALYAARDELGAARFDELLGVVRAALRARLDRALSYSS